MDERVHSNQLPVSVGGAIAVHTCALVLGAGSDAIAGAALDLLCELLSGGVGSWYVTLHVLQIMKKSKEMRFNKRNGRLQVITERDYIGAFSKMSNGRIFAGN